ncbi:MAG: methyltransferase type 12, partial [SAR86 cluster bacterium]|nr:methyltransferase type 12 [SAR86 cluster bacterium]
MLCNICGSEAVKSFLTSDQKTYWSCSCCGGKFLDKDFLLNSNDEKERYLEHNNEINDPEYRSFLSKLVIPLKEKILPSSKG